MNDLGSWLLHNSWLLVGSVSGSMCAMFAARNLNLLGRLQTLAVGTLAGCFAGPFVCELWFSQYDPLSSRVPSFVCFVCGAVALAVVPVMIRRAKDIASKFEIRLVRTGADNDRE
jgi:uncharacterized membrane protein YeaQ/YmgE (transglycosylase-associated protein family)